MHITRSCIYCRLDVLINSRKDRFEDITTPSFPQPTATPSGNVHTASAGAIIGGAVGGGVVLGFIIIIIIYLYWKRHMSSPAGNTPPTRGLEPFLLTQSTVDELRTSRTAAANYDSAMTNSISIASTRQAEIDRQIWELTREMQVLAGVKITSTKRSPTIPPSFVSKPSDKERASADQIQRKLDTMRGEIEHLRLQLHSDWARGLTNDPPPSYHAL
ncbi:hypothetical protein C0992_002994 [Termitomyces sp. T32_za158]|nr:hypothetical protein C0992_002994 [Termitomyces sp. T32_za158]